MLSLVVPWRPIRDLDMECFTGVPTRDAHIQSSRGILKRRNSTIPIKALSILPINYTAPTALYYKPLQLWSIQPTLQSIPNSSQTTSYNIIALHGPDSNFEPKFTEIATITQTLQPTSLP